jgi:hypothetical protein
MSKPRRGLLPLILAGAAAAAPSAPAATPSDSMTQGKLALDLGDLAAAERAFTGLAADPTAPERVRAEAAVRLGVVGRALGKMQASARAFSRAIESPARDAEVTRLLALALTGVAPESRSWAREWRRVRFESLAGPAGAQPSVRWPSEAPQDLRATFPADEPVTFDLEDVPLMAFLHNFLHAWRPDDPSCRRCQWPGPRTISGFESWPESYQPPADVERLDWVIHSGIQGEDADGPDDIRSARITVKASGVPWNELFENVLASHGLGFVLERKLLFIARTEDLGAFERIRHRTYGGPPISLMFLYGRLPDVFRLIGDVIGLRIVPDEGLPGSFTTLVTERPAMEVFDLVLAATDLALTRIRVPDGPPGRTALRVQRLADAAEAALDLSQLDPTTARRPLGQAINSPTPARFSSLEGAVQVRRVGSRTWIPARKDTQLNQGDLVRTGPDGRAEIRFADGFSFRLKPDSLVTLDAR